MPEVTITTTNAQADRIQDALGKHLSLMTNDNPPVPRPATGAEIKSWLIQMMKETVRKFEHREAEQTARDAITDIEPT